MTLNFAHAGVIPAEQVINQQQHQYNKQQILAMVETTEVQQKLVSLGVSPEDAKSRIANMTNDELAQFNEQMENLPAGGGIVGTIITVLVVIAVLDVLGVTDVYSFIRPIN